MVSMERLEDRGRRMLGSLATGGPPRTVQMIRACCLYLIAQAAVSTDRTLDLSTALEALSSLDYQGTFGAREVVQLVVHCREGWTDN